MARKGRYYDIENDVPYRQVVGPYVQDVWAFTHFFLELRGPAMESLSVSQMVGVQKAIVEILSSLPEEIFQIQASYSTAGDFKPLITQHVDFSSDNVQIANYLREQRTLKLLQECHNRKIVRPTSLLVLSCAPPDALPKTTTKVERLRLMRRIPTKEMTQRAHELLRISRQIVSECLAKVGVTVVPWTAVEVADYLYNLFNPRLAQDIPLIYDPEITPFNDAWLRQNWELQDECWKVGAGDYQTFHGFVSMNDEPRESVPGIIRILTTNGPVRNVRVVTNIRRVDRVKEQDDLRSKLDKTLTAMRDTTTIYDKIFDPRRKSDPNLMQFNVHEDETAKSIRDVLRELTVGSGFNVVAQVVAHTWADTKEELELNRRLLLAQMSGMGSAVGVIESFPTYFVTLSSLPGAVEQQFRARKVRAKMAADLMPLDCGLIGNDPPVALFKTAAGGMFPLDLFSKTDVTAPMTMVSGSTGTGKSFLVNQICLQHIVGDPIVLILDVGGSYRRQTDLMGGKTVAFDFNNPFCFNPFQVYGANADGTPRTPTPGERAKVAACIEALLVPPDDPQAMLDAESISVIDTCIEQTFHHAVSTGSKLVRLSDFHSKLTAHSGVGQQLALRLSPFLRNKPYGMWIDGPTQIDLETHFLNLDLKGIKKDRRLCAAMIPILVNYIEDIILKNPAQRKIVIMDELWDLITNSRLINFVVEAWKTFRKEGAAVIGSTQSLGGDIADSPVADAIIGNTHTWFLLNQGAKEHLERACKILNLTEGQREILSNTKYRASINAKGEMENYRSCLMVRGASSANALSGEILIEATPAEYWLNTTDPDEIALFRKTEKAFDGDLLRTVEHLAKKYPYGVVAQRQIEEDKRRSLVLV
jgi:Type IV secretory pathway, VirB4 components